MRPRRLVIDGCVRDAAAIRERGFPVFCRGTSMKGSTKTPFAPEGAPGSNRHDANQSVENCSRRTPARVTVWASEKTMTASPASLAARP